MAPPEQTSLVAEIPCYHGDELWEMEDEKLISLVSSALTKIRWINREEVVDGLVTRLRHAYPVLQIDHEQKVQAISRYLGQFSNLTLLGRSGTFLYVSFHQIMRSSKSIIDVHLR